jgi:hypothetical protein
MRLFDPIHSKITNRRIDFKKLGNHYASTFSGKFGIALLIILLIISSFTIYTIVENIKGWYNNLCLAASGLLLFYLLAPFLILILLPTLIVLFQLFMRIIIFIIKSVQFIFDSMCTAFLNMDFMKGTYKDN